MARCRRSLALVALAALTTAAPAARAADPQLQPPVRTGPITLSGEAYVNASIGPYAAEWTDAHGATSTGNDASGITIHNAYLRCDAGGTSCSTIPGATAWGYQLTSDDEGHTIRVRQYASNAAGDSAATTSDATAVVQYTVPTPEGPLGLFGKAIVGEKIGAYNGGWIGSTMYFEAYLRCDTAGESCVEIPGQGDFTYTLTEADLGHTIRVREYATNGKGSSEIQLSPASGVVVGAAGDDATQPTPTPTPSPAASPDPTPLAAPPAPLPVLPTPAPAATPAPAPAPAATKVPTPPTVSLLAGTLTFTALPITVKRGKKCPASVLVAVKAGTTRTTRRLRVSARGGSCQITGALKLTGAQRTAASATVTVTGNGITTTHRTVRRG